MVVLRKDGKDPPGVLYHKVRPCCACCDRAVLCCDRVLCCNHVLWPCGVIACCADRVP